MLTLKKRGRYSLFTGSAYVSNSLWISAAISAISSVEIGLFCSVPANGIFLFLITHRLIYMYLNYLASRQKYDKSIETMKSYL